MIRGLTIVAIGGAILCIGCIGASGAIGAHRWHVPHVAAWHVSDADDDDDDRGGAGIDAGPSITRDLPWAGGSALTISVPAVVTYTQGAVPRITLTGPQGLASQVKLDGDTLTMEHGVHHLRAGTSLTIAITAPAVHSFTLQSAQQMTIDHYDADTLAIAVQGAGKIEAHGTARAVTLTIEGAGDADLGSLATTDARIEVDGLGNVTAAPTGHADVQINGAGNVTLTRRPARLDQQVNGAGHISQPDAPAEQKL